MEEIFFLNYQRGINSWTPTDLSGKCDDDEIENHWSFGRRQKGCELTLVSCSLLFAQVRIYFYLQERKKTFCARFWDCRPGCHSIVKKKYWNKDVKVRIATCLGLFFTVCVLHKCLLYCKRFLKYFYCTVTTMHYKKKETIQFINIFFCQWCCCDSGTSTVWTLEGSRLLFLAWCLAGFSFFFFK